MNTMEREIKFRAWNGKEMFHCPITTTFGLHRFFGMLNDECKVMQYTGLKDNTGKEIYEGDIIGKANPRNPLEMIWGIVVYVAPSFQITVSESQSSLYTKEWIEECIILGNMYENPELIYPHP